jgi:hypothetical protein
MVRGISPGVSGTSLRDASVGAVSGQSYGRRKASTETKARNHGLQSASIKRLRIWSCRLGPKDIRQSGIDRFALTCPPTLMTTKLIGIIGSRDIQSRQIPLRHRLPNTTSASAPPVQLTMLPNCAHQQAVAREQPPTLLHASQAKAITPQGGQARVNTQ